MALFGWMSTAAYAQLKDNIEVNVFGAGSVYTHKDYVVGFPQTVVPNQGRLNFERDYDAGVRVGVYDRGHWSEEIFYSYGPNKAHLVLANLPNSPSVVPPTSALTVPIQVHRYGVTALYYFNENEGRGVRPFVSIGIGGNLYRLTTESESFVKNPFLGNVPSMKSSNEVAMNYGIGLKARMNNWVGFRTEAKGFLSGAPSFGLPHTSNDPNVQVLPVTGALHSGELSVGLVFYFFNRH
jgi:hypothetical protein